ncbi:DUF2243 domain-containing protein (plasmid) [Paracoccus liaowanqingii]|uniref:DUF2243 domain-containing protein n=1 Tax=Paracoccus liaowanqingii TaxID=2560053 RepID=A0A4Y5SUK2_9RHOB|nr:DUF2243 domain-containing protein [Paracoccus liaowanqingii]QDA36633.1 DUF2243 domain-containing protein [Paracoccus liaowanqingii]
MGSSSRGLAAGTLGVALGGFFDGILLHQILQWHHLLSLVPGMDDLRGQVLWDGYFHAGMYLLALIGLVAIWRGRARIGQDTRARLWAPIVMGFGAWHVLDTILSHWLLGIHRVKLDATYPLAWDLGWLLAFGLLPVLAGLRVARRGGGGSGRLPAGTWAALVLLTGGLGAWGLVPPPGMPLTAVVFRAGVTEDQMQARLAEAGAEVVWQDGAGGIAIVALPGGQGWRLYGQGALLVAGSGLPAGCFSWTEA